MSLKDKAIAERDRLVAVRQAFIDTAKVDVARMQAQIDALNVALTEWKADADVEKVIKGLSQAGLIKVIQD